MSFTYPIFLWGLTALAIPIIVHLFNFRKAKKVSFSNVRFLESIKKKNASNLRLRHLLILLCRLLFIFFLVLTFAQPFIPSQEEGLKSRSVSIYLDNSQSMSNLTDQGISGFSSALSLASEITALYPPETKFNLLTNDFLNTGKGLGRTQTKTAETLTELEHSNLSRSGKDIFGQLRINDSGEAKDIFVLTDLQRSTFGQLGAYTDSINHYHLIKPHLPKSNNIAVDTIFLANPFLVPNQKNSVHVRIKNQGPVVNDLQVKFFINSNQNGTTSIDIDENAQQEVVFEIVGVPPGANQCLISFEDFPVSFDNDYYFTLNQASKIKIVEISDGPNTAISRVYRDNSLFTFTTFHSDNISYPTLETADLLVVNELPQLENGLSAQIEKHLSQGKSVIFIPQEDAEPYQFAGLQMVKDSLAAQTPLSIPDLKNPFFDNIFESLRADTQMPEVSSLYQWTGNDLVLLKSKTGNPYLSQMVQKGNLYLLASPLKNAYTNFHLHALFVPVMHRIAELSGTDDQALAYTIDEPNLTLTVDSIPNAQLYKLIRKETELIPSQRLQANELILDMPKYLLSPGFYDLTLGDTHITTIAFNHSKAESEMNTWSIEEAEAQLAGIEHLNFYQVEEAPSFSKFMKEKYHRREIWKYTLLLSLIFLFAESVLLRFL